MKKISLILLLLFFLAGCSSGNIGSGKEALEKPIQEDLMLKVDKSKILYSETVKDIKFDEKTGELADKGDIKEYLYISDKKVAQQTIADDGNDLTEIIEKRTENTLFFEKKNVADKNIAIVYSRPLFYQEPETKEWYEIKNATTTVESYDLQVKETLLGATATTTSDGAHGQLCKYGAVSSGWTQLRSNTGGTYYKLQDNACFIGSYRGGSNIYYLMRGFFPMDTSGLPTGATISSASLYIYVTTVYNQNNKHFVVTQSTQSNTETLTDDDYDNITLNSPDEGSSDIAISGLSTNAYNAFALNATGIDWIVDDGITKLAVRNTPDIDNALPAYTTTGHADAINWQAVTNPPYLRIEYTEGGAVTETRKPAQSQMLIY